MSSRLAEGEGFEPPVPLGTAVFKTAAFDHSATPPVAVKIGTARGSRTPNLRFWRPLLYQLSYRRIHKAVSGFFACWGRDLGSATLKARRWDSPDYSTIWVTRPEPMVRPPSRMAKVRPSSIATGWINSTSISVLSPGIIISAPSLSDSTEPVMSLVRK